MIGMTIECTNGCFKYCVFVLPDPTARIPDCGGLMIAQNCLMPKGPPRLDTVNVPPCKEDGASFSYAKPSKSFDEN